MTINKKRPAQGEPAEFLTQGVLPADAQMSNTTLDRWFQQGLSQIYDDLINEPLPEEFLAIVRKIGKSKPPV